MYTVVVADDEEELRRALIRRVNWESVGFQVIGEAENGVEALELVEKLEPDLLLTDIHMPFISGIELARQVREIRPTMHIVFLSGYDDFTYAQQAIQYNIISYLLKPISSGELTLELAKIKEKIDEKFKEFVMQTCDTFESSSFLMPLLLDGFQDTLAKDREKEIIQTAIQFGLFKSTNPEMKFVVMISSILDETGMNQTKIGNVNAIDIILRKYVRHVSFYAQGKVISLLIATQGGFDKYLHIAVKDIIQSVNRVMNCNCAVGISRSMSKLSIIHEAYVEAMNVLFYSIHVDRDMHFISDMERNNQFDPEMVQGIIDKIENLTRTSIKQELETYLKELFVQLDKKHFTVATMNSIFVQLVSAVFRIAYAVLEGEEIQELQEISPLQGASVIDNKIENWKRYVRFCLTARELIANQRKKSSTVICDKALELIENQYMDSKLSLVSISNEIAVSPNYLSTLIKKSTGSTFVDLLAKRRIEKAKELLYCSSMKIKDISEECGYSDQHYFSYCFKKYTGLSPNSARRQSEEEK